MDELPNVPAPPRGVTRVLDGLGARWLSIGVFVLGLVLTSFVALAVAEHNRRVLARPGSGLVEQHIAQEVTLVAVAGGASSAALALAVWLLLHGRARALELARRTKRELRAREERLRSLDDNLPDTFVYQITEGPDGRPRFLYISSGVERVLGVSRQQAMADSSPLFDLIDPQQVAEYRHAQAQSRAHELDLVMDLHMHDVHGASHWLQLRSRPRRDADGRFVWDGTATDITERKRIEAALADSQARYERVLEGSDAALWDWNLVTGVISVSPRFATMLGYPAGEWVPTMENWLRHTDPSDVPRLRHAFERHLAGHTPSYTMEFRMCTKEGEWIWVQSRGKVVQRDALGRPLIFSGVHADITERKRAAQALHDAEQRFHALVDSTDGIVWEADARSLVYTYVSHQATRLLGQPLSDWKKPGFWVDHLHPDDRAAAVALRTVQTAALRPHDLEYRFLARDGRAVWLRDIVTVVAENGAPRWLRGVMIDITRQKQMEAELRELATTDLLTGLANRRHFMSRLHEEHARLQRAPEGRSTVLTFDIDHFKRINDTFGHAAGDVVLRWAGARVRDELRRNDVAGRLGGEEFAVLLSDTELTAAASFAERLRRGIAEGSAAGGTQQAVTVSIGLATMDAADASAEVALGRADAAMYRAKRGGRNRVEVEQRTDPDIEAPHGK